MGMAKGKYYHYFVEGQDEEKLLVTLKTDMRLIKPGKIQVFNVVEKQMKKAYLLTLKMHTTVVFVFDTDTGKTDTLKYNIKMVEACPNVDEVICVVQNKNLENELKRACNIREIKDLTGSKTNSEYKHDLIAMNNLAAKLRDKDFHIEKLWTQESPNGYEGIKNGAEKIKKY